MRVGSCGESRKIVNRGRLMVVISTCRRSANSFLASCPGIAGILCRERCVSQTTEAPRRPNRSRVEMIKQVGRIDDTENDRVIPEMYSSSLSWIIEVLHCATGTHNFNVPVASNALRHLHTAAASPWEKRMIGAPQTVEVMDVWKAEPELGFSGIPVKTGIVERSSEIWRHRIP